MDAAMQTLLERLAETVAWCSARVDLNDPKGCFRTAELRPHPLAGGRKAVVEAVTIARYVALGWPPKRMATDLSGGQLLTYQPDLNLVHGLEEMETCGYVDIDNIPPWDTWIDYICEANGNYLLCWVPAPFIPLVADGIAVNPELCFQWLDDTDFDMGDLLKRHGIETVA